MFLFVIKNYYSYQIRCVLKVLTNTIDIQNLRIKPILNVQYTGNPKMFIENQHCFSQPLETRITFISTYKHMTYNYYSKQPKPMCESKLNQLLHKNPYLINGLDRFINYPFIQENAYIPAPESLFPQIQEFKHESLNTITFKFSVQGMSPISINFIDQTFVFVNRSV